MGHQFLYLKERGATLNLLFPSVSETKYRNSKTLYIGRVLSLLSQINLFEILTFWHWLQILHQNCYHLVEKKYDYSEYIRFYPLRSTSITFKREKEREREGKKKEWGKKKRKKRRGRGDRREKREGKL